MTGPGGGAPPRRRDRLPRGRAAGRRLDPVAGPGGGAAAADGASGPAAEAPPAGRAGDPRSWLDDGPPGGFKPKVHRPRGGAPPPPDGPATGEEAAAVASAFLFAFAAVLLLWPASSAAEFVGAGTPGAAASWCAWRATVRRRRELARHLRGGAEGKGKRKVKVGAKRAEGKKGKA